MTGSAEPLIASDQELNRYNIATVLGSLRGIRSRATADDVSVVLFGAGQCGRLVADWMAGEGLKPLAFCDNNEKLWGKKHNGILITWPDFAAHACPMATFVVCVRDPDGVESVRAQLDRLGVRHVDSCSWMVAPPDDVGENLADAFADDASCWECFYQLN